MGADKAQAQLDWQAKLDKYPSLRKFDELGDDYVEVRFVPVLVVLWISHLTSGGMVAKRPSSTSLNGTPMSTTCKATQHES